MYPSASSHLSPASDHIFHMMCRIRQANARYSLIAREMRTRSMRNQPLIRQFRLRAAWIGLRIDVKSAVKCPSVAVSKIPLAVLSTTPSPPVYPKVFIRIPAPRMRTIPLPSITATAPTPVMSAGPSETQRIYSPLRTIHIPAQSPIVAEVYRNGWIAPGAPRMKTMDLPECEPVYISDSESSGSSIDCDSASPYTPQDFCTVYSRASLPNKRKLEDTDEEIEEAFSQKHQLKKRWSQSSLTYNAPRAIRPIRVHC